MASAKTAFSQRIQYPWRNALTGLLLATIGLGWSLTSQAQMPMTGTKKIVLSNAQGEREVIGTIAFDKAVNGKTPFKIEIDPKLGEYFLAMRPFRCLSGEKQRLCWFPVQKMEQVIAPDNLVALEYALMFMKTGPKDLHINPFNGEYYKLEWTDKGISGKVYDVDMDPFITPGAVPPAKRERPVTYKDISEADPKSHWLPNLNIE